VLVEKAIVLKEKSGLISRATKKEASFSDEPANIILVLLGLVLILIVLLINKL
jgi:hypothetical protein